MEPRDAKGRFEEFLAISGVSLASLTPAAGLEMMTRFYGENPARDSLTYSWGIVSRYGDQEFGFDVSRWLEGPLVKGEHIAVLSLKFKIGPEGVAGEFGGSMNWCCAPEDLPAFRATVEESPPFKRWGQSPAAVALVYLEFGNWREDLFDYWGVRDPSRPVVSMTEAEWLRSDDVSLMLRWFRQEWRGEVADLDNLLQRYLLACCRRIWRLLPQEESRAGVEIAERFLNGTATAQELGRAKWGAEGAAFVLERGLGHDLEAESIARWVDGASRIPSEVLRAMLHPTLSGEDDFSPHGLLSHAAYFAHSAMGYPGIEPKESIESYRLFLPTPLLREILGNPFRATSI